MIYCTFGGRMKINRIGYHYIHPADFVVDRPEGSGDYLLLVLKTSVICELKGAKERIPASSFILFDKGTPQIYYPDGDSFINDWVHLVLTDEEIAEIKGLGISFDTPTLLPGITDISDLFRSMCYAYYGSSKNRDEIINHYFKLIFLKLSEDITITDFRGNMGQYQKIMTLRADIYNSPLKDWTIEGMANQAGLSRSYFQHLYRNFVGLSAMEDVITSRLEYAKHLLGSSSISVRRISEQCGYDCEQHFLRQFKSRVGMTPGEYRKTAGV